MEVSSTSINAASATVAAISQGLTRGFHIACRSARAATGGGAPPRATVAAAAPAGRGACNSDNQSLLEADVGCLGEDRMPQIRKLRQQPRHRPQILIKKLRSSP